MQLAGPLGRYMLLFFDIAPDFKSLFSRLMTCLEGMQRFEHTTASLEALQTDTELVLSECESKLPLFWCCGVKHYLLHVLPGQGQEERSCQYPSLLVDGAVLRILADGSTSQM